MNIRVVTDKDGKVFLTVGSCTRMLSAGDARTVSDMMSLAADAGEKASKTYLYEHTLKFPD